MPLPDVNLTNDVHLAAIAIAIEHNATLHSADNDFRRFPKLKFKNPLADAQLQEKHGNY